MSGEDWFANVDWDHHIRIDGNEKVMLDVDGPGAVVRMWTALHDGGVLRMYVDGELALETDFVPLLQGQVAPFTGPFAQVTSAGRNLDFPFPFARHMKITVENPGPGEYWYILYRRYEAGTDVRSWDGRVDGADLATIRARLEEPPVPPGDVARGQGGVRVVAADAGSELTELRIAPRRWDRLGDLWLVLSFDGRETVRAPLVHFFGLAPGFHPHRTLPLEVTEDGVFVSRFVMPFACDAVVRVDGAIVEARHRPAPFVDGSMHFHARWTARTLASRPFRDVTVAEVTGRGRWVATSLSVDDSSREWWGEGDEKVWVDDDALPSWFGTGTEDYFGYAYATRDPFDHPYRALRPWGRGRGQVASTRVHVLDAIPFAAFLRFDLELFHWDEHATLGYDTVGTYYLAPD